MRNSGIIAAALVLPFVGACATAEPEREVVLAGPPAATVAIDATSIAGHYTLVGYGADPLPITVERDRVTNCVQEVTEGELHLEADGKWNYTYVQRDVCEDDVRLETESVGGTFEIRDGRLFFDEEWGNDGPEGEGAIEPRDFEVGWFENEELRIEPEGIQGIFLVFRR